MAAGALCKMRMYSKSDQIAIKNQLDLRVELSHNPKLFHVLYQGANSAGKTEISAPNAVFNNSKKFQEWSIVSAHADDTDNAAKDCREVSVIKLMKDGTFEIEALKTDGVTDVPSVDSLSNYAYRIMHMYGSAFGSAGSDAKGDITLQTKGYQEGGLVGKQGSSLTGLVASTAYQYGVNEDGAGNTNYTFSTGTNLTWTAVLALMNAQSGAKCLFELVDGDIRCSSLIFGATSAIEMSAGGGGNDLFATLTGWAEETAVAGAVILTIAAGKIESDGAAIYVPNGLTAQVSKVVLNQLTYANDGLTVIYVDPTNMGQADPDLDGFQVMNGPFPTLVHKNNDIYTADSNIGKLTFSEIQITGAETFQVDIWTVVNTC